MVFLLISKSMSFYYLLQSDGLPKYGWLKHDGVNFGVQEIQENDFIIKTEFVKQPGGSHGGDWTARFSAVPTNKVHSASFHVFL